MATFNVTLKNAKFLGLVSGQKFQILVGEEFTVDLIDYTGEHRWTTFWDKLLALDEKQFVTKVKALVPGSTELQIQDLKRVVGAYLVVEIIEGFPEPTIDLGGSVEVRAKG